MQFGHAGSCANAEAETATAKNKRLSEVGAHVPSSFDELGDKILYALLILLLILYSQVAFFPVVHLCSNLSVVGTGKDCAYNCQCVYVFKYQVSL